MPLQAKRVALVMGNDNYTAVNKLQKAGNDATAMARELKNAGFTVQLHKDLNYLGMVKAVENFTNGITGGDEVVVFFAGHGVQIKNGSYLLPTDIEAYSESQVEKTAYELLALTDKISEARPAFSLVMVDACRDNPLKSRGRNVGNARGLSAIEPPKGQMVVYSASRGQQALDRLDEKDPNPNGVFTRELIKRMKKPGVKIEDLLREVQDSVEALAKTINHDQRPAIYNEARGNFYFIGPTTVQTSTPNVLVLTDDQKDQKFWDDAKAIGNKAAFEAYILSYPNGKFVALARANIARLDSSAISEIPIKPMPISADEETKNLFKKATEQKDASAQFRMAVLLQNGKGGLSIDPAQALLFYKMSADQNNRGAQFALGYFYATGNLGVLKDDILAEKFFRLSANQGYMAAQDYLGHFYFTGRGGLQKNHSEAAKFFKLAADQGDINGLNNLGDFYVKGLGGLPKDEVEAAKLYRLASNLGNQSAQMSLASFHAEGRGGLPKDVAEALKLYRSAADKGNQVAQEKIKELERQTPTSAMGTQTHQTACPIPIYPASSKKLSEEGQVTLSFQKDANGNVFGAEILNTSGFERLDAASLEAIKKCKFAPPGSNEVDKKNQIKHTWRLEGPLEPKILPDITGVHPGIISCPAPNFKPLNISRKEGESIVKLFVSSTGVVSIPAPTPQAAVVKSSGLKKVDLLLLNAFKYCAFDTSKISNKTIFIRNKWSLDSDTGHFQNKLELLFSQPSSGKDQSQVEQ